MAITVEYDNYLDWADTQNYGADLSDLPSEAQDKINEIMDGGTYTPTGDGCPDDLAINRVMEHSFSDYFDEDELEQVEEEDDDEIEARVEEKGATFLARDGSRLWILE